MRPAANATILIVEDDAGVARLQQKRLERAGYAVVIAGSAAVALEVIENKHPDLVLLDYRLPDNTTGLEFYQRLKAAGHDVPTILVTGFSDESLVIAALRAGVRDFITKSFEYLEYLPEAVERTLNQLRVECRLADSEDQLRQSQKMEAIGRLAGGIAHDFNNYLTIIIGYCDLAMDSIGPTHPAHSSLQIVRQAAEQSASLPHQLLAFSRKLPLLPKIIDLNAIVQRTEKMLGRVLGDDIRVELQLSADLWHVKADHGQTEQVVMNLAVNARDAMPRGGVIRIETANVDLVRVDTDEHPAPPGEYALLTLSDTGCGMDEETKRKIFEPFFTTKGEGKGTGLGLATVYGIVQQSGGFVTVDSKPGNGTTFKIYWPRVSESTEAAFQPEECLDPRGGEETILLVENQPEIRLLARTILENNRYTVLEAPDGETAIRIGQEYTGTIDVLLTDVFMPKMSGRQVADRMRPVRPQTKVLYMSGYAGDTLVNKGVFGEGVGFLQKPFTEEQLLRAVQGVLTPIPQESDAADNSAWSRAPC